MINLKKNYVTGLHNETYKSYDELHEHYRDLCIELRKMYHTYVQLPSVDDSWTKPLLESIKTLLEFTAGNTDNDDLIIR